MKKFKIISGWVLMLIISVCAFSCDEPDREPDITPADGKYVLPDAPLLSEAQKQIMREIQNEYIYAISEF